MPYNSIRRPERARQNQTLRHAAVAHLVERHLAKVEVASSSLVGRSITEWNYPLQYGPVAQLVRAPACHAGGRRFEPDPGRFYASVAQSVEQGTENPRVIGSIPIGGTINADVAHPVERHLAKVEVASSSLVIRSINSLCL